MSILDDIGSFLGGAAPVIGAGVGSIFGPAGMAIGGQLGGALSSFLNSNEASKISSVERKKLQDLLAKVKAPDFDPSKITPQDFKVVGQYTPQVAQYVQEQAPQLLQASSADQLAAKDAQRQALSQMIEQARSGKDVISDIQRARAAREASSQAASNRASLDEAMQRRGMAPGAGLQYAAALQGNAVAAQNQSMQDENALLASEQRRQNAGMQAANLGGQMFNRDLNVEQQNAQAINDFNRRIAESRQNYGQYAANLGNQAQQYNLGNMQSAADRSVQARNAAQQSNLERGDRNAQNAFSNSMGIYNAQANAGRGSIDIANTQAQQRNLTSKGIGDVASTIGNAYAKKTKDPYSWEGGY